MEFDRRAQYALQAAERGEFAGARRTIIDLVAEDYSNAEAHRAWGQILLAEGKSHDAAAAFRTALELDDSHVETYFDLAEAAIDVASHRPFLALEHWSEARQATLDGLARMPHSPRGLSLMAAAEQQRSALVG